MQISGALRRSSPSPREQKKKGEDFKFSRAVNKLFAELVADWKLLMRRKKNKKDEDKIPRMPKEVENTLRAEALQFAKQGKTTIH